MDSVDELLITANLGDSIGNIGVFNAGADDDDFDIDQLDNFINGIADDQQSGFMAAVETPVASFISDGVTSSVITSPCFPSSTSSDTTHLNNIKLHMLQQQQQHQQQYFENNNGTDGRVLLQQQQQQTQRLRQPQQRYLSNNNVADNFDKTNPASGLHSSDQLRQQNPSHNVTPETSIQYEHSVGLQLSPPSCSGPPSVTASGQSVLQNRQQVISTTSGAHNSGAGSPPDAASVCAAPAATVTPLSEEMAISNLSQQVSLLINVLVQNRSASASSTSPSSATTGAAINVEQSLTDLNWLKNLLSNSPAADSDASTDTNFVFATSPDRWPVGQRSPMMPPVTASVVSGVKPTGDQYPVSNVCALGANDATHNNVKHCQIGDIVDLTADILFGPDEPSVWQNGIAVPGAGVFPDDLLPQSLFPYTPPDSGSSISSPYVGDLSNDDYLTLYTEPPLDAASGNGTAIFVSQSVTDSSSMDTGRTPVVGIGHQRSVEPSARQQRADKEHKKNSRSTSHVVKKRKLSPSSSVAEEFRKQDPGTELKTEPVLDHSDDDEVFGNSGDVDMSGLGSTRTMRWSSHQNGTWAKLLDERGQEISTVIFRVACDKGLNYQLYDNSFICQKKNHFQVTVEAGYSSDTPAAFVRHPETGRPLPVTGFYVHFHGIKTDLPTHRVQIEQSRSDRSKHALDPIRMHLESNSLTKVIAQRMHFSETTANNMRKRGKPNPDQRYFQLVVSLCAHHNDLGVIVAAQISDKIIVRASNPGQFEADPEMTWMKGKAPDTIFHVGNVAINTDNADEALTVHGNIHLTGRIIAPSDVRVKKDIKELDTTTQLQNISKLKVYSYGYIDEFSDFANLPPNARSDTGMLAQDVRDVIPDAVQPTGNITLSNGDTIEDFLVVNKDRIFFENVGAVKELCKVTHKLEMRIEEMEVINKNLMTRTTTSRISLRSNVSTSSYVCSRHQQSNCRSCASRRNHQETRSNASNAKRLFCSNRVIQIATIILIIFMTLCVAAITTLYILSKETTSSVTATNGTKIEVPVGQGTSNQTNVTIILASSPTVEVTYNSSAGYSVPSYREPISIINCTLTKNMCLLTCCPLTASSTVTRLPITASSAFSFAAAAATASDNPSLGIDTTGGQDIGVQEQTTSIAGEQILITAALNSERKSSMTSLDGYTTRGSSTPVTMETTSMSADQLPPAQPSNTMSSLNTLLTTIRSGTLPSGSAPAAARRKRSTSITGLGSLVSIYLVEADQLLTVDYCQNVECLLRQDGNYTYYIPVNNTFPPVSLTVNFTVNFDTPAVDIVLCDAQYTSACGSWNMEKKRNGLDWSWSLPVGLYYSSTYTFRMSTSDISSDTVCTGSLTQSGNNCIDFNLFFERTCL